MPPTPLEASDVWRKSYPDAAIGVLEMHNVANPSRSAELEARKSTLAQRLRTEFEGKGREVIKQLPVIEAYNAYYQPFRKTYHVELQLASVALKGREIPSRAALVEAMFMAELEHLLLTAGHDLDAVVPPVRVSVADGTESYVQLNGEEQTLKQGDMFIADEEGVISSIIYGPDRRSQIRRNTERVLFLVYAPAGVATSTVEMHLRTLRDNVHLIAHEAEVVDLNVVTAQGRSSTARDR